MSDCEKCWETPCACGHEYRDWSVERVNQLIATLHRVLTEKQGLQPNESVSTQT